MVLHGTSEIARKPLAGSRGLDKVLRGARFMLGLLLLISAVATAQDIGSGDSGLDDLAIPQSQYPLCFGLSGITEPKALEICDALRLNQNVRARELSEQWLRENPDSAAAQFALSEVLFSVEGNLPRALYHLKRAEQLTNYSNIGRALESGNLEWHYLTLSQLSYVHQLMGNQVAALEYLDKINTIYSQEIESFRGWPLIKMKQFDAARTSANQVLENSNDSRERARAWNTLCAVELASLRPKESLEACNRAIDEDEAIAENSASHDTVYLVNASEVALSLLQIEEAEEYLDQAARYLNPQSVADPWIYKLYLTMNQSRFDEARNALDRMLVWRESQIPVVGVMNRAEHFMVSASFLLVAGYAEDAARLTESALNQPDRNGSYSADDAQKDSIAALLNMMANNTLYQMEQERIATLDFPETLAARIGVQGRRIDAWRAGRRAAALFADEEILQNRLRPYAPLDVHIPEWIEPELVSLMGPGIMSSVLESARERGAFSLNDGYYFAYRTEIAAVEARHRQTLELGEQALRLLPFQEKLLQARLHARMGEAAWKMAQTDAALVHFTTALQLDPSIVRRLGKSLPVRFTNDGSEFADQTISFLQRSPRFESHDAGLTLEVSAAPALSACLYSPGGEILSCQRLAADDFAASEDNARELVRNFHNQTFGLGYDISQSQRMMLMGSSVILSSQRNENLQRTREAIQGN
ncbi:MAG: hypothetical protein WDZ76_12340 [Pseudohongiellaceae bacterium]